MSDYIEILSDESTFEWSPKRHGKRATTVFTLRKLPDHEKQRLLKRHRSWKRGAEQRDEIGFTNDALDYCIISWDVLRDALTKADVPVTRDNKLKLPEWLKGQVVELCLGGDVDIFEDETEEPREADPPAVPSPPISTGSTRSGSRKRAASDPIQEVVN